MHFVWTCRSCVTDDRADIPVAGAGAFSVQSCMVWNVRCWGHLDEVLLDDTLVRIRLPPLL